MKGGVACPGPGATRPSLPGTDGSNPRVSLSREQGGGYLVQPSHLVAAAKTQGKLRQITPEICLV